MKSIAQFWDSSIAPILTEDPRLDGFCKYWHDRPSVDRYADRMERRQAEFLTKGAVPLARFARIGVIDDARAVQVRAILAAAGVDFPVVVMRDWLYGRSVDLVSAGSLQNPYFIEAVNKTRRVVYAAEDPQAA